jgi:hypothetical protein
MTPSAFTMYPYVFTEFPTVKYYNKQASRNEFNVTKLTNFSFSAALEE